MMGIIFTAICLGVGLAMDAFSVSLANGLHEPKMKPLRVFGIAGTFATFQGVMPLLGWLCVHTVLQYFEALGRFIPWIAFALLGYIGGKMIWDGVKCDCEAEQCCGRLSFGMLMIQGIATSIDALSVGFAIAENTFFEALISVIVIATVTMAICTLGIIIGKAFGKKLSNKASIFGGVILLIIGLEILITSLI